MNDPASIAPARELSRETMTAAARSGGGARWEIAEGLTAYPDAIARMEQTIAAIRADTAPELVWFVEHPPLYTAGSSARPEDLEDATRFPTFSAGRGGQWTYHGPGQRVAYVMLDLHQPHGTVGARDIRAYVHGLEEWLILTLDRFNIKGERRAGRVGIWVVDRAAGTEAKIGAIGVRVTRWVTWHGISLNLEPTLDHFAGIVPCGIREYGVTSLHAQGIVVSMAELDAALAASWSQVFGAPLVRG
jgi:lipoyl(octanoyl) transferase